MKIISTNGCYDILHIGHIKLLKYAKSLGDKLIIGINSDSSIKQLKGNSRPINNEQDRKQFLEELGFIDEVIIFDELNAVEFLKKTKPNIYVCGGNYNLDIMNQNERQYLELIGAKIDFFTLIKGYSSSKIIDKIKNT